MTPDITPSRKRKSVRKKRGQDPCFRGPVLFFFRVQLKRQHGFSCCHLQVYRLIRQDLTALSLLQTFANVPFKPIGKLLPIAV
jgi:hypothetical protein